MIEQAARRLPRTNEWHGLLPAEGRALTPAVHFEPIAAGDVVLNSRTSPVAERLRRNYNDAVAVDMEDAEFAKAGHLNEWIPLAAVRGISDVAGGERAKTDDEADDGSEESNRPPSPRIHNTSIAKGKAQVGQQSGVNFGIFYKGVTVPEVTRRGCWPTCCAAGTAARNSPTTARSLHVQGKGVLGSGRCDRPQWTVLGVGTFVLVPDTNVPSSFLSKGKPE